MPTHKSCPLITTAKRLPFDTRFRLAARQPTSKRPPEGGSRVSSTPLPGPRQRFVERGVSPPSRLHSPTARSLSLEVPSFIAGPCERKSRSRLASSSSSSSFSSANPSINPLTDSLLPSSSLSIYLCISISIFVLIYLSLFIAIPLQESVGTSKRNRNHRGDSTSSWIRITITTTWYIDMEISVLSLVESWNGFNERPSVTRGVRQRRKLLFMAINIAIPAKGLITRSPGTRFGLSLG